MQQSNDQYGVMGQTEKALVVIPAVITAIVLVHLTIVHAVAFFVESPPLILGVYPGLEVAEFLLIILCIVVMLLKFTYVHEGTAKAVMILEGFYKIIMQWRGRSLNEETGDVVSVPNWWAENIYGGLRIVGIRGIHHLYWYMFRWTGIVTTERGKEVEFNRKKIDYILLRPDPYITTLSDVETKAVVAKDSGETPERIPISLKFAIGMEAINPEKALFKAPSNWEENVMLYMDVELRSWAAEHTLDEILQVKSSPEKIWEWFQGRQAPAQLQQSVGLPVGQGSRLLDVFKSEWGVKIRDNEIMLLEPILPDDYRRAAALQKQRQLEAQGLAAQTTSIFLTMLSEATGKDIRTVKAEIAADPKRRESFEEMARDFIVRSQATSAPGNGAFKRIEFVGAGGGIDLAAALGMALRGDLVGGGGATAAGGQEQSGRGGNRGGGGGGRPPRVRFS